MSAAPWKADWEKWIMVQIPCLLITSEAIAADPALDRGNPEARGARKVLVTWLFDRKERHADNTTWDPNEGNKVPVLVTENLEIALFNEQTTQDRHYHGEATETYVVLEGTMRIKVGGEMFEVPTGGTIVVLPGVWHEVQRDTTFTAQVICANCGGDGDKFTE